MPETNHFEKQSIIPVSVQAVWDFHAAPDAFRRLTPPPVIGQIQRDERASLTQGELAFTLWFGPLPIRWVAAHEPGPSETSFVDRMVAGPFDSWVHQHLMEPVSGGTRLTDRIAYTHKPGVSGLITRLLFNKPALRIFFTYRHWITRRLSAAGLQGQEITYLAEPESGRNDK